MSVVLAAAVIAFVFFGVRDYRESKKREFVVRAQGLRYTAERLFLFHDGEGFYAKIGRFELFAPGDTLELKVSNSADDKTGLREIEALKVRRRE